MTQTPKISDSDFERLQDHVRLLHGLDKYADVKLIGAKHAEVTRRKTAASRRRKSEALFAKATESTTTMSPCLAAVAAAAGLDLGTTSTPRTEDPEWAAFKPRTNKTYLFRRQCVQKRIQSQRQSNTEDTREAQRIRDVNLQPKNSDYFRLNKAFHMRWKKIRSLPVVHSHFRDTYLDTGKPPFVVPVHYKPFNVYWDADYAKQEFIFLDAAAAEEEKRKDAKKKKNKTTTSTTEPPSVLTEMEPSEAGSEPQDSEQPRKTSSQLIQERKERESTGYEGFPRETVTTQNPNAKSSR